MRIEDVNLSLEQIANDDVVLLLETRPYYAYVNQQKTDKVEGYTYVCCCPKQKYERIMVKIESSQPIIENDKIVADTYVSFDGFNGRFYRDRNGVYQLSCKAEAVHLVDTDEI